MKRKKGLFGGLIQDKLGTQVDDLSLDEIHPDSTQPRKHFDEKSLADLSASIKTNGVHNPIHVIQEAAQDYTILTGERRYRAAKQAGLHHIPAIVHARKELSEEKVAIFQTIENLHREDLAPLEQAQAFKTILDSKQATQAELAKEVGLSESKISRVLALLSLPKSIQNGLADNPQIPLMLAYEIAIEKDNAVQWDLWYKVVAGELETVRQVRQAKAESQKMVPPVENPEPKEKKSAPKKKVRKVVQEQNDPVAESHRFIDQMIKEADLDGWYRVSENHPCAHRVIAGISSCGAISKGWVPEISGGNRCIKCSAKDSEVAGYCTVGNECPAFLAQAKEIETLKAEVARLQAALQQQSKPCNVARSTEQKNERFATLHESNGSTWTIEKPVGNFVIRIINAIVNVTDPHGKDVSGYLNGEELHLFPRLNLDGKEIEGLSLGRTVARELEREIDRQRKYRGE